MRWVLILLVFVFLFSCSSSDPQPIIINVNSPSGIVTLPARPETGNITIVVDFDSRNVMATNHNDRVVGVRIYNDSSQPFQDNWIGGGNSGSAENVIVHPDVEYKLRVLYYTFNVVAIVVRAIQDWENMNKSWVEQEFNSTVIFNPNTQTSSVQTVEPADQPNYLIN